MSQTFVLRRSPARARDLGLPFALGGLFLFYNSIAFVLAQTQCALIATT